MKLKSIGEAKESEVELIAREGSKVWARIDGVEVEAEWIEQGDGSAFLSIDGRKLRIFAARREDSLLVAVGPASLEFKRVERARSSAVGGLLAPELTAPMPGKVLKILVGEAQQVNAGDPLLVLEAMKMETILSAEAPARISKILVGEGQMVEGGAVLIQFSPISASVG
jgi:acetyl/propionyl-CoA carboxylase alpha subunit